jgi:hypothetical protein
MEYSIAGTVVAIGKKDSLIPLYDHNLPPTCIFASLEVQVLSARSIPHLCFGHPVDK